MTSQLRPRREGGGTEVLMRFDGHRDGRPLFTVPPAPTADHQLARRRAGRARTRSRSRSRRSRCCPSVLGRVARTVAATAHFSLDRFSDVYLITDALAAHAGHAAAGDRITARLTASERRLWLSLGPFRRGTGSLLEARAPSPLSMLADELTVSQCGADDAVELVVLDGR